MRSSRASTTPHGEALIDAITGELPPRPPSVLYWLGLLIVSAAMLLLPLIYLALVGTIGWGVWWHATHSLVIFDGLRPGRAWLVVGAVYAAPLVAGPVAVLFMLKPFLAPRVDHSVPLSLTREDQLLLFRFVERLCEVVGAPLPRRIDVDGQANASASFRKGLLSLFRNDLVLTIGLPLAATLSLRQFAGVLAHEFGHFRQAGAMRLTFLIRTISHWLARAVYERDRWDQRLEETYRNSPHLLISLVVQFTRLMVWLSRRVLWILMWIGHGVAGFMLRQMEYDADRSEIDFAGSETFEATMRRLPLIEVAGAMAWQAQQNLWHDQQLMDNLPALVIHQSRQLPEEARRELEQQVDLQRTGLFDTHPAPRDRIAAARAAAAPGIFQIEAPASVLFRDFDRLCRLATAFAYKQMLGPAYDQVKLISTEDMLRRHDIHGQAIEAMRAYTQDLLLASHPLWPAWRTPSKPIDRPRAVEALTQARRLLREQRRQALAAAEEVRQEDQSSAMLAGVLEGLQLGAKVQTDQRCYEPDAMADLQTALARSQKGTALALEKLETPWKVIGHRLALAMQVLAAPQTPMEDQARKLRPRAVHLQRALEALRREHDRVRKLEACRIRGSVLFSQLRDGQDNEKLLQRLQAIREEMNDLMATLRENLVRVDHPFEVAEGRISMGAYAFSRLPARDDWGEVFSAAENAAERLSAVYMRAMAHLIVIAVRVERCLGLEPLELPPQAGAAGADPENATGAADQPGTAAATKPAKRKRYRYMDANTKASDPGLIVLSHDKLRQLRPEIYHGWGRLQSVLAWCRLGLDRQRYIAEHLEGGDSRAAVVVSVNPLLVAAYTSELDCVAMLRFPDALVEQYGLKVGSPLLTVNTYARGQSYDPDLTPGPRMYPGWKGFAPMIADFLTDDLQRLRTRKSEISREEWKRAYALGQQYLRDHPGVYRDGRPIMSGVPAVLPREPAASGSTSR